MRLLWCIFIEEPETRICGIRIPNRPLAIVCAVMQFSVALASLFQVGCSVSTSEHTLLIYCFLKIGNYLKISLEIYLAYDVIIFDFGLMHRVLGTDECVANYLDGGYMRFGWCIEHTSALSLAIFSMVCMQRPLWLLWPALLIQSSYSLGLSVLTMATLPKFLEAVGGRVDVELTLMLSAYSFGFTFNWMFTFILWHHYWHLERLDAPPSAARRRSYKAPGVLRENNV
ncbi:unnamed protein product [Angiostrongylus costaricensis]|uniref:G protein-coupled receptor n=1 Tax=Angiostrongylus costaricensis TaxID=334426 RepID=A0A158PM91_ANGCS|nr:unnamed protein product [Angiostrongylus costaricensis]